jgi:hypothetical protein
LKTKKTRRPCSSCPPREQWTQLGHPAGPKARAPRVFLSHSNGAESHKRPLPRVAALVLLHPPKPPPRPAGGSHCLGNHHLGRGAGWWVGDRGHRKGQLCVLGSPSALHTKKPRTGGGTHRGGGEQPADPIYFCESPLIHTWGY